LVEAGVVAAETLAFQDLGYKMQKMQDTRFRIQNAKFKIQDTRFRIQDTRFRIQEARFRRQEAEPRFAGWSYNSHLPRASRGYKIQKMQIERSDLPRSGDTR
jgi:hypothetical protein